VGGDEIAIVISSFLADEKNTGVVVALVLTIGLLLLVVLALLVVFYRRRNTKLKNEPNVHYMANPDDPQGNLLSHQYPSTSCGNLEFLYIAQIIFQGTDITSIIRSILITQCHGRPTQLRAILILLVK